MLRVEGGGCSQYCDDVWRRWEDGKRLGDVTHVTSAARSGQGVMDDSASIQEIISTYQKFDILCLLLQMCQIIRKICVVFETRIDLYATLKLQQGIRSLWRHILGSRAVWWNMTTGEGVIFSLKLHDIVYGWPHWFFCVRVIVLKVVTVIFYIIYFCYYVICWFILIVCSVRQDGKSYSLTHLFQLLIVALFQ